MSQKFLKTFFIIVLFCVITIVANASNLNELQDQKKDIEQKVDEKKQELSEVTEELSKNLQQIQKLDESIEKLEQETADKELEIQKLENEIKEFEKKNIELTQKYDTQKELLDFRLSTIYENGNYTYLEALLKCKNISDFVSTYYLLTELAKNDLELLEDVAQKRDEIRQKSEQISKDKKEIEREKLYNYKTKITMSNTKLLRENYISQLSQEEKEIQAKIDEYNTQFEEIETEIKGLSKIINFGEDYKGGTMQWPIYGHYTITSDYGMRIHPITGVYKLHTGVDIAATLGTNFTAIADGIVVKAEFNSAYGNMVIIDHGGGIQTLYAHGSEIIANLGQQVKVGDVVLKVGSTGYSTGPHAHFEVRIDGNAVNPLEYVSMPEN